MGVSIIVASAGQSHLEKWTPYRRGLTGLSIMSRLATRGSDPIDQATIRGYVLNILRRGEEEEVCTGGRAELYTC